MGHAQQGQQTRLAGTRVEGELLSRMEREAYDRDWTLAQIVRDALDQRYSLGRYSERPEQRAQG